jgi:hypothetical protein
MSVQSKTGVKTDDKEATYTLVHKLTQSATVTRSMKRYLDKFRHACMNEYTVGRDCATTAEERAAWESESRVYYDNMAQRAADNDTH